MSSKRLAPAEEMLPQLASGLTACWPLTKTSELEFVQAVALSYLPTLTMLAKQPSCHQHEAMRLTAEAHMLAGLMGMHLRGLSIAKHHFSQAVTYSQQTTDDNLNVNALNMLSGVQAYERHYQDALDTCKKAILYEKTISPLIRSDLYSNLAMDQAQCDDKRGVALSAANARGVCRPVQYKPALHLYAA